MKKILTVAMAVLMMMTLCSFSVAADLTSTTIANQSSTQQVESASATRDNDSFYGFVLSAASLTPGWNEFDANGQGTYLAGTPISGASVFAAEYYNSKLYGYTNTGKYFILDGTTFALESQATVSGKTVLDMAYDYSSDTMYAIAANNSDQIGLYTSSLTNGMLTLVANFADQENPAWVLACTTEGQLYCVTINGTFASVNKSNATITNIATTGKTPNYIQSMCYNHYTRDLVWAYLNTDGSVGELYKIDCNTGSIRLFANVQAEISGLHVRYDGMTTPPPATTPPPPTPTPEPGQVTMYGFAAFEPNENIGWHGITNNGVVSFISGSGISGSGIFGAEYVDGYVYGYTDSNKYVKYTPQTFSVVTQSSVSSIAYDMAYDYSTNTLYGLGNDASGQVRGLYTIDVATGAMSLIANFQLAEQGNTLITLACTTAGQLYGIGFDGVLYTVDKTNAAVSTVGSTGKQANYVQSMAYDHNNGIMYWAQISGLNDANYYSVNLANGSVTRIASTGIEFCGLHCVYNPDGPQPTPTQPSTPTTPPPSTPTPNPTYTPLPTRTPVPVTPTPTLNPDHPVIFELSAQNCTNAEDENCMNLYVTINHDGEVAPQSGVFNISYDPAVVEYKSRTFNSDLGASFVINTNEPGLIRVSFAGTEAIDPATLLITFDFEVKVEAPVTIHFELAPLEVVADDTTTMLYAISEPLDYIYDPVTYSIGDVNMDGNVDTGDAAFILRIVAGLADDFTDLERTLADINGDGNADTGDAAFILRCVAGLDEFPA